VKIFSGLTSKLRSFYLVSFSWLNIIFLNFGWKGWDIVSNSISDYNFFGVEGGIWLFFYLSHT